MSAAVPAYEDIAVAGIAVRGDRRRVDAAWVAVLAKSIDQVGLVQPITVVREEGGSFTLVAGAHRLAAVQSLGGQDISARVLDHRWIKSQERKLQEVTENVVRRELTTLERARALAERKAVYEELYPDTKHGGDRKSRAAKKRAADQNDKLSFCSDTHAKTGLSQRSVERLIAIWTGLDLAVRVCIDETWLADHQAGLTMLSAETPERQVKICKRLFAEPPQSASVAEAVAYLDGRIKAQREPWAKVANHFARLNDAEREQFFIHHEEAFRTWLDTREGRK